MQIIPDEDFIIMVVLSNIYYAADVLYCTEFELSERSHIVSSLFTNNRQKEGGGKGGGGPEHKKVQTNAYNYLF